MVSGTDLFFGLFNNLAIFIILVTVYGGIYARVVGWSPVPRQIVIGLIFGVFAVACMHVKIVPAEGVIVDQRNAIVVLGGAFGGPIAAVISGTIAACYRIYLGGIGVPAGVVGISIAVVAGVILYFSRSKITTLPRAAFAAFAAAVLILPGFLLVGDLHHGWELLKRMALPYGTAIFLGIFLVGLLLAREEHRYAVQKELYLSERRFRGLFENLIDVSYRTDRKGNFELISPSSTKIFGYSPEEVIGKQIADFYRIPARREEFVKQIGEQGAVENFEAEIRRKDGSFVWISTNAKVLTDIHGTFIGIEGVTRDISRIKEAEQEKHRLEESLRQSQKMEAIGTLAGGIAHDFNNILTAIIGYAEMSLLTVTETTPIHHNLKQILKASARAKQLIAHILTFSRRSELQSASVEMRPIVEDTMKLLRATLPATIEIAADLADEAGFIFANPTELHQVVMNLGTNGAQAMEHGGLLTIVLRSVQLDEDDLKDAPDRAPGRYVRLSVSDTGSGIASEDLSRIFDPYFTTKEAGKGSGLGLSVVKGIVDRCNGFIDVHSSPGHGTEFSVYFPAKESGLIQPDLTQTDMPSGSECILLIDDEEPVIEITTHLFEQLGYRVISTTSAAKALELFTANPSEFDLIITDQTMPNLTGAQLAEAMLAIREDLPIILCSGYSPLIDADKAKRTGIAEFMLKPVDRYELAQAARRALDRFSR